MLLIYLINPSCNPVHVVHLSFSNIDNIDSKMYQPTIYLSSIRTNDIDSNIN